MVLPSEYYENRTLLDLSRDLLGKYLFTKVEGIVTGGRIVETEAYMGAEDRGSHAYLNRNTPRTRIMFGPPGNAYVYLCYGIHSLFNIVAGAEGEPYAVLVRGLEPVCGIEKMLERRGMHTLTYKLTAGPGALAAALGITREQNGLSLQGPLIWLEDRNEPLPGPEEILASPRVGMNFTGPWHSIPWRFRLKGNAYTSRAK